MHPWEWAGREGGLAVLRGMVVVVVVVVVVAVTAA